MPRILFPFLLVLLTGCASLPDHIACSEATPESLFQDVYVSSDRLPSIERIALKRDRKPGTVFAKYRVSIPPTHEPGGIEWPDGEVDPLTDFTVIIENELNADADFLRSIKAEAGDELALFFHGCDNTPSEALYRDAQVGHDLELGMPRVLFSWPSARRTTGYSYDRDSVLFSRNPHADLLTDISRKTNKKIVLSAHSIGAHLTMEVLRQLAITGRRDVLDNSRVVVLLTPDIDPDIFRIQARAIGRLPDPFIIMSSRGDRALNLSAFLNIGRQKVGDLSEARDVEGLNVTLLDFTALADGSDRDHLVPMTSPAARPHQIQ